MKRVLLNFLFMLPIIGLAQGSQNFYAELGGPGFLSVNYDKRFTNTNNGLGFRAGIGIISDLQESGLTIPLGLNYLIGKRTHFLELGLGISYVTFPKYNQDQAFNFRKENFVVGNGWLGYKYQPINKGFTFRAGLCEYFNDLNLPTILGIPNLYPGLSFGYSF